MIELENFWKKKLSNLTKERIVNTYNIYKKNMQIQPDYCSGWIECLEYIFGKNNLKKFKIL